MNRALVVVLALATLAFVLPARTPCEAREFQPDQVAPAAGRPQPAAQADGQAAAIAALQQQIEALRQQLEQVPALQQQILELEQQLAALKAAAASEPAPAARDSGKRLTAYYRDGFFIATEDDAFRLQIGGVLHFDTRMFGGGAQASPGGFDIRRGRYDFRGTLYGGDLEHVFRLQFEMANTPYLRNAYWMFKFAPAFNLQLGQFKPPAGGADWLTEEGHINFAEYSIQPPVTPFFDRGINIHSFFANRRIQTNLALVTGVGTDAESVDGDLDNHFDVAARVMVVPWRDRKGSFLEGLHLAGSFQDGRASIRARQGGETGFRTENFRSKWYDWKPAAMDLERRTRYGWDAHLIRGPYAVSAEWNRVEWDRITSYTPGVASLPGRAHADAGQVWVSWFVTGEQKTIEDVFFAWRQPKPKQILSLRQGTWGGWELIAKYSYNRASDELFDLGILDGSRKGHAVTGGVRWLWNPRVRLMVDVNHLESTDGKGIIVDYSAEGTTKRRYVDHENAVIVRLILSL